MVDDAARVGGPTADTFKIRGRLISTALEVGTAVTPLPEKDPASLILRSLRLMHGWSDTIKDDLGGSTVLVVQVFEDLIAADPSAIDSAIDMGELAHYPQASLPALGMMMELANSLVDARYPRFAIEPAWARTIAKMVQELTGTIASPETIARARLSQIERVIERFASDPTLTPESLAAALHISRRTLYDIATPTLGGISEHLRQRRAVMAREILSNALWSRFSVAEIATRTGFSSAKHLRRALSWIEAGTPEQIRAQQPT